MSKVEEILHKLNNNAREARASCIERGNWEDYDFNYKKFEDQAVESINQLLIEAKINELKRAKLNSYIPKDHLHKVDRRIFELQQSLKDKEEIPNE